MTSRIDLLSVSSMTRRSTPTPSPGGRRQPVLERAHVILVHRVRFLVALRAFLQLLLEAIALLDRIVQLAERVGDLHLADVQLEPLDGVGIARPLLRQRRHFGWEVVHEGRLDERFLDQRLEDRRRDLPRPELRVDGDAEASPRGPSPSRDRADRIRPPGCPSFFDAASAAACRSDTRANGARSEIVSPSNCTSSLPVADSRDEPNQLFGHRHQVLIVAVGLIELEHRELGIVPRRDPLVPEIAVDLVHALEPADDQPLQIELRRDAQKQIDVERVVMRAKRPRHRAAGDRLHHRRLDLEISAAVEKFPQRRRATLLRTWNTSRASGLTIRSR